jgi:hypothetical protein
MAVTIKEWDGGEWLRSTQAGGPLGRGGRRHAPVGNLKVTAEDPETGQPFDVYTDAPNLPILFEDERSLQRAAARLTPNVAQPNGASQAQLLFNRRGGRLAFPTEVSLLVKVTPSYAVVFRGLVTHATEGYGSPVHALRVMRSSKDPDFQTAYWLFRELGYVNDAAAMLALPFKSDAPAGSMTPLRNEAIRKLGGTADLRAVLGPEAARAYAEDSDDTLGALLGA